jgi:hypothetical protein
MHLFRRRALRLLLVASMSLAVLTVAGPSASAGVPFDAAGCEARMAAGPSAPPIGTGPCDGVRPGAYVHTKEGGCTLNFVFNAKEGSRTIRYVGTAGHCILPAEGEVSWDANQGPKAYDGAGDDKKKIGEFVYAVVRSDEDTVLSAFRDFALIRLDAGIESRVSMCHFGGPTGMNNDIHDETIPGHFFGQGLGFGSTVPARTLLVRGLRDPDVAGAAGPMIYGDSGAGVISEDGRAIGVIVQFIDEPGPDLIGITRLRPQVSRAEHVLGVDLTLLTAALR